MQNTLSEGLLLSFNSCTSMSYSAYRLILSKMSPIQSLSFLRLLLRFYSTMLTKHFLILCYHPSQIKQEKSNSEETFIISGIAIDLIEEERFLIPKIAPKIHRSKAKIFQLPIPYNTIIHLSVPAFKMNK